MKIPHIGQQYFVQNIILHHAFSSCHICITMKFNLITRDLGNIYYVVCFLHINGISILTYMFDTQILHVDNGIFSYLNFYVDDLHIPV